MIHLHHIGYQLKYDFYVHPEGFAVHFPHPESAPLHAFNMTEHRVEMEAIGNSIREDVQKGTFVPVTSFAERCSSTE